MRERVALLVVAVSLAAGACKPVNEGARAPQVTAEAPRNGEPAPTVPFEVRATSTEVLWFWFDERGAAHSATMVDNIPAERRAMVRVDPTRPELRAPGWVYLADLRTPDARGVFPARAVRSEELSQQLMAMAGGAGPQNGPSNAEPGAHAGDPHGQPQGAGVIIYGASWCHACHDAAAWLRDHHVAFVEKDIEQDPAAHAEMMDKARRANVPTGSIPIIDVRGRVMVGFSAPDLERALAGG